MRNVKKEIQREERRLYIFRNAGFTYQNANINVK